MHVLTLHKIDNAMMCKTHCITHRLILKSDSLLEERILLNYHDLEVRNVGPTRRSGYKPLRKLAYSRSPRPYSCDHNAISHTMLQYTEAHTLRDGDHGDHPSFLSSRRE